MDSVERLVGDLRARQPRRMEARERTIVWTSALAYTAAAVALAVVLPWNRSFDPWVVVLLLAMFVAIDRIHFEIGSVTAVAVPLVFVPMLFLLPLPLVPVLAPAGYLAGPTASPTPGSRSGRCWSWACSTTGARASHRSASTRWPSFPR
jgi:hypothetical protein